MVASLLPALPVCAEDEKLVCAWPEDPPPEPGMLEVWRLQEKDGARPALAVSFLGYARTIDEGLALARARGPGEYQLTTRAGECRAGVTI